MAAEMLDMLVRVVIARGSSMESVLESVSVSAWVCEDLGCLAWLAMRTRMTLITCNIRTRALPYD